MFALRSWCACVAVLTFPSLLHHYKFQSEIFLAELLRVREEECESETFRLSIKNQGRLHFLLVANLAHPPLFFFPAFPIFQPGGNAELCEDADSPRLFKRFQLIQNQLTMLTWPNCKSY